jgi:hypothetical protein
MALRLLLLVALIADVSPKGLDPVIPVEKLGSHFQSKGSEEDRGLKVSVWWNATLERDERWHCTAKGEWFLRARTGIFVLAAHEPGGGWVTCPAERLVWRDKAWTRITIPIKPGR